MPYVISISGPPGAGKTSLTYLLKARLRDAVCVQFDHYQQLTQQPLDAMIRWLEEGADIDRLIVHELSDAIATLKRGHPITDPASGQLISTADTILFETPFGRRHTDSGQHIDLSLWIDVPLDLALARRVHEMAAELSDADGLDQTHAKIEWIQVYLENYLNGTQRLLQMQIEQVRPSADVVINGMVSLEDMADEAAREIQSRSP